MLTAEDITNRDRWLSEVQDLAFKELVFVGNEVSKADVERWLRDALGLSPAITTGHWTISATQGRRLVEGSEPHDNDGRPPKKKVAESKQ